MNPTLLKLLRNYRHYHTHKGTVLTHFVGIPLVTFAMLILFSWFQITLSNVFSTNIAWVGVVLLAIYYCRLNLFLGLMSTALLIVLALLANYFSALSWFNASVFLVAFVLGWIFQLWGHKIEGNRPALLDNFFDSVFIAPFFIVTEWCIMLGFKKSLQKAMDH